MSASDIELKDKKRFHVMWTYIGITLFCIFFSAVYEHFSHGVYSNFMVYMFLFPLVGGAIPFFLISTFHHIRYPRRMVISLYHSGIATLTVGSCLRGVLDIYGTTSGYVAVYWFAGAALIIVALGWHLLSGWRGRPFNKS